MKISEMTNEQAAEAIIRLADPIGNLCDDEDIANIFNEVNNLKEVPLVQSIGRMLPKFILYGFKKHLDDLYEIVGALTMQPTSKVAKMNFVETVQVVKDSYDEVLAGFFTRSKGAETKSDEKSL